MSIDEAIEKHRRIAETKKTLYDACILEEYNRHLLREYKEHEQLAEWLEELKALREKTRISYNKAIDDFVKKIIDYMVDYKPMYLNLLCIIEEIAEQLKAGGIE